MYFSEGLDYTLQQTSFVCKSFIVGTFAHKQNHQMECSAFVSLKFIVLGWDILQSNLF